MIFVAIAMIMAPSPVFLLFFGRNLAELAPCVPVSFIGPLPVKNQFVIVPDVIVGVIGVVDAIGVTMTGASQACCGHCRSEQQRKQSLKAETHAFLRKLSCGGHAGRC